MLGVIDADPSPIGFIVITLAEFKLMEPEIASKVVQLIIELSPSVILVGKKETKSQRVESSILQTTNRKAVRLIVRVAVDSREARVQAVFPSRAQAAFPSIRPRHGRRPKVRERARTVESAISTAAAGKDPFKP